MTIDSLNTVVANLTASLQAIYGADINVNSNSPDGQLINIFSQTVEDLLMLLQSVYASFGYETAYGTQLDNRLAILGLARLQGTYTTTPVLVTVNQALTLYGLNQTAQPVYTLVDQGGNLWQLVTTYAFAGAGNASLLFQAADVGEVQVTANTITGQNTTVLGVTSVNNPVTSISTTGTTHNTHAYVTGFATTAGMSPGNPISGAGIPPGTTIVSVDSSTQVTMSANATASASVSISVISTPVVTGVNEETDTQYKVRAAQSFALASTGPADAISAALLNTPGITDASVIENDTGSTVGGVPAHSIWTIVNGGTGALIGQAIYAKKMPGCGMIGANSYVVTRPNGTTFTALWDSALSQPLYIAFGLLWRGNVLLSNSDIETQLAAALTYKLNDNPNIGDVITAMQTIAPTAIVIFGSSQGVSTDNSDWLSVVVPTTAQYYFTVSSADITIS